MKSIVFYGAFDRYNYGDNLMPILLSEFINQHRPELKDRFKFQYASISESDLTKYRCLKSKSISSLTNNLESGSSVIVVGGEVLCGRNSGLFLHMQSNAKVNYILTKMRRYTGVFFKIVSDRLYSAPWEFPYIVPKPAFKSKVKVIFNTVGGSLYGLSNSAKKDVTHRLNSADYISVRDTRTQNELSEIDEVKLVPDSAFIMSELISDEYILNNIQNKKLKEYCSSNEYFIFQAAPNKVGCDYEQLVKSLKDISEKTRLKICLVPIGYASGHDDFQLLEKLNADTRIDSTLFYDLNIWEIMFSIKNAKLFIGTSLHGVITAMSYCVPHFGVNKRVGKLDSFLKDWSISPFNECYELKNIPEICANYSNSTYELRTQRDKLVSLVIQGNHQICDTIYEN
ncbi:MULTISPECIES: polysaccharide pyruvyl transferase family protein [Vibrio]|uniref:polysaccharide pyruvyl transferase family protein n=1 Tax=Vibrio TaxID=662 RepID=UPI0006967ACE|nr:MULTISPECIES: polysaccharide pyruvyl transferase family protein [Vibrio]QCI72099.1 polysaccharide pyruvyl transferase family protein [Vibrio cyclitrophicus]